MAELVHSFLLLVLLVLLLRPLLRLLLLPLLRLPLSLLLLLRRLLLLLLLVQVVQELRHCQSIKPQQTSCRSSPLYRPHSRRLVQLPDFMATQLCCSLGWTLVDLTPHK